jgi:hypothetical protein
MSQVPSIGRVVHAYAPARWSGPRAALITQVHAGLPAASPLTPVNARVFVDQSDCCSDQLPPSLQVHDGSPDFPPDAVDPVWLEWPPYVPAKKSEPAKKNDDKPTPSNGGE